MSSDRTTPMAASEPMTRSIRLPGQALPSPDSGADTSASARSSADMFLGLREDLEGVDPTCIRAVEEVLVEQASTRQQANALLAGWLRILSSDQQLMGPRGASHWHRNGFAKVNLGALANGLAIRLHYWPARSADGYVHDHRWDFASVCMAGSLDCVNFDIEAGDEIEHVRLSDADSHGMKENQELGRVALRPSQSYSLGSGQVHALALDVAHRVANPHTRAAVTVMVSLAAQRPFSNVFGQWQKTPRTSLDDIDARRVILTALDLIAERPETT